MKRATVNFDFRKATQALNYFAVKEGGRINKMKALKLLYLADRYHLRKYGRLITNDIYFAMNFGPVPSSAKDIAKGSTFLGDMEKEYASRYLAVGVPHKLQSRMPPDNEIFSDSDIEALNFAWDKFGCLSPFQLAQITHQYPEWSRHKQALKMDSRVQMDISDFFEDPPAGIDKCFELNSEEKEARRQQLAEISHLESLWS